MHTHTIQIQHILSNAIQAELPFRISRWETNNNNGEVSQKKLRRRMVIAKQRIKAKAHEMKQAKQELVDKGELSKSEANRIRVYPYSQYDYSNKDHQNLG